METFKIGPKDEGKRLDQFMQDIRNWRSAYEGSSRLRSNEVPGGDFKRQGGLAPARWRGLTPDKPW